MRSQLRKRKSILVGIIFLFLLFVILAADANRTQAAEDVEVTAANKKTGIQFSWDKVPGASYYYIHITASATGNSIKYKVTDNSYLYGSVGNGSVYKYKVCAYNGKKEEIGKSKKVKKIKYLLPTSILDIGENNKGTLTLSWKQNKKADSFKIYKSADGGKNYESTVYKTIKNSNPDLAALSFTDSAVVIGKEYRYRVYAISGDYRSCAATSKIVTFNHTSDAGTVVMKPTCTTGGITVYRCKYCKKELSTKYPGKLNHSYGKWVEVSAPTCQEKGVEIRYCTRSGCGASEMRETQTTDHEKMAANPEAVTCTKGGTIHYVCRFCGKDMGSEYKGAKDHTVVKDPAVRATATQNGKTEGSHCAVCGMILEPQKVIPMTAKVASVKLSSVTNRKGGILVKWKQTEKADGYLLFRKTGSGAYKKLATFSGNKKTTYTDKKVMEGNLYFYHVKAFRNVGGKTIFGAPSEEKTILFLPAVKFKRAKSTASDSVTLFWKKVKKCSGYQIRVNASGRMLKTGNAKKNASSVTIRRLNRGTYKIYIRAYRKKDGKTYYGAWCLRPVVFTCPGKAAIGK